ncbi:MAG: hypothetical protein IJH39_02990, partial [Clostridia bacterium]|nr:hypothetical protein [Clostridia bacterium]
MNFAKRIIASFIAIIIISTTVLPSLSIAVDNIIADEKETNKENQVNENVIIQKQEEQSNAKENEEVESSKENNTEKTEQDLENKENESED